MRLFSRVTVICNFCFIIAVLLRWVEISRRASGNFTGAIKFQPLEATLVILGYGAIFLNAAFLFLFIYRKLVKKMQLIPRWIVLFNLLIFPLQVYFFFFST